MPTPGMDGMPMPGGAPSIPPTQPMGDPSMNTQAPMGDPGMQMPVNGGDMGQEGNEGFEMGIGMSPEEDPKKYIEGAVAKVASELRKYQNGMPSPDMELNKTAVNTIAAATKTNAQPNQVDELMTSYSDTMRKDGDSSDNDSNINSDTQTQQDTTQEQQLDQTNNQEDMSQIDTQDPTMAAIQEAINKYVREGRLQNINKKLNTRPRSNVEQPDTYTTSVWKSPLKK